jgi:DNA polymerase-3 subunit gamma/tau
MSYQVLARKWRPRNFREMVGQESTLRMLMNALDSQRLHHAYLFTGTRGVGKTSLARILAKCLNCETGITSEPCGTCSICQSIDAGKFLDLIEVDAASRTKVEDTREILDNVQYSPTQGRYKIYLIDEVHMLSGHSFNALLKTLEEPPAHVKFLLATTDPKRLPVTILSRCLQFNLKRVPPEQITKHLQHLCEVENISFENPALDLIAKAADGSMRDALSLLDQTIAYCGEKITTAETRNMLGSVEKDAIYRILNAVASHDGKSLLDEVTALSEHAPDFSQVLEELLSTLHQISVTQIISESMDNIAEIAELAKRLSAEDVQLYYQIALIGRRDLSLASDPQQGFEMVMLRMLAFKPMLEEIAQTKNISPEKSLNTPTQKYAPATPRETAAPSSQTPPAAAAAASKETSATRIPIQNIATPVITTEASKNWVEILPKLGLTGMAYALASNCTITHIDDSQIKLVVSPQHEPMLTEKMSERLEEALGRYFNKPIKLDIKSTAEKIHTPAKQKQDEHAEKHQAATQAINNDTHVKKMLDMFDATLDVNSIKALDSV